MTGVIMWPAMASRASSGLGVVSYAFLGTETLSPFSVFSLTPLRFATSLPASHLPLTSVDAPLLQSEECSSFCTVSPALKFEDAKHSLVPQLLYSGTFQGAVLIGVKNAPFVFVFVL